MKTKLAIITVMTLLIGSANAMSYQSETADQPNVGQTFTEECQNFLHLVSWLGHKMLGW